MKKIIFLFIGVISMFTINAQDINDALRYSSGEVIGSARYRALSGAFGALGGDLSAVSVNPASSAVFTNSLASVSLNVRDVDNETLYFGGVDAASDSDLSINQGGGVFVFKNRNQNSAWKKFALSIAFDNTKNYDDNWNSRGVNTTSIGEYFFNNAQGLRLDQISALPEESSAEAYANIGSLYGYANQQAFLGYDSFILEPENNTDDNTVYSSNIMGGKYDQNFTYAATGYNGKIAFNIGTQYGEDLYLGLNLNSHFLNFEKISVLRESNNTSGPVINDVFFENVLITNGSGFSFQLGGIYKITNEFRVGLSYDSPTWMTITEESSQFLQTRSTDGIPLQGSGNVFSATVDPQILNLFPDYNLKSPGKITGSLAYVFGKQGLISFDYSRRDFSNTKLKPTSDAFFSIQNKMIEDNLTTAATYKLGGEYKVNQFSFRGGYRFEESPYKNGQTIGDLNGYSLGLGFSFGNTILDITYDAFNQSRDHQLYNTGLTDATTIDANNSNITLTLGFQL